VSKLIKSALLFSLAFVGWRLVQPRVRAYQFADIIKQEVESKQVRPSPMQLRKRIFELGVDYGLPLTENDDQVVVTPLESGGFEVKVHYDVPVDLGMYIYQEHFDFVSHPRGSALPE
jgi:hypothetical protein